MTDGSLIGARHDDDSSVAFIARKAGAGSMALGVIVLLAWLFGVEHLTEVRPGLPRVDTATAICLVLFGAALLSYGPTKWRQIGTGVLAWLVTAIGLATLTQSAVNQSMWVDRLLTLGIGELPALEVSRMSWATAVGFTAVGLSLMLLITGRRVASQLLASVTLAISGLALIGYLYDATSLYAVGTFSTMAYLTTVTLQSIAIGALTLIPGGVPETLLRGQGGGSVLQRRMLPTVMLGLPLAGLVAIAGVAADWYSIQLAFAMLVVFAVSVLTGITLWASTTLDKTDGELVKTLSELRDANATLETRVLERTERLERLNYDLGESEQQYRSLVETSPLGIFRLDNDGVATFVNDQLATITGFAKEDHLGPWLGSSAWLATQTTDPALAQLAAAPTGVATEIQWVRPDGQRRNLRIRIGAILGSEGVPGGRVGIVSDITDEVTSRVALTQAQERLRLSFDHAPIGKALVTLPDIRILQGNRAMCTILGIDDVAEIVDRRLAEFLARSDHEKWQRSVMAGVEQHGSVTWNEELRCIKGAKVWASLYLSEVKDPSGGIRHGVLQMVDATDERIRTRSAEYLNEVMREVHLDLDLEAMLQRAVSSVAGVFDANRVGIRFLREHESLSAQWAADGVASLGEREMQGALDLAVSDAARGSRSSYDDVMNDPTIPPALRAEAERLSIGSVLTIPILRGGKLLAALVVAQDGPHTWTPDEVALGEQIADGVSNALWNADLLAKETELASSLKELDAAKTDFVSSVSHELRTPLTSINGYLELLTDEDLGPLTDQQHKTLGIVQRNGERLLELVEDLLTMARIESGELLPEMELVQIEKVLREVLAVTKPQFTERSLRLELSLPDLVPSLKGDERQLERVFLNLLSNAAKFTPPGGSVRIAGEMIGDSFAVSVSDTGIGIAADEQKQLFTRFFRATTAQRNAIQGTGLGLAIVKMIIENHHGSITVESEPNRGTTFRVFLPVIRDRMQPAVRLVEDRANQLQTSELASSDLTGQR